MWIGSGGRIMIGLLAPSGLAVYSVAFRFAGLALGLHQIAITGLFAYLYRARTRVADRLFSIFLLVVLLALAILPFAIGILLHFVHMAALQGPGGDLVFRLLPILGLQIFLWIAFAMFQLRVNRSGLASRSILPMLAVTLGGIGGIYVAVTLFSVGLVGLCWLIAFHNLLYVACFWWLLVSVRLPHRRMGWTVLVGVCLLSGLALLQGAHASFKSESISSPIKGGSKPLP
jgi:hypothetical protein